MPAKEITPHKIGIMTEDGFHEIGSSIENITLEPEERIDITSLEDSAPVIVNGYRSFEYSFELDDNFNWSLFRRAICGSNNWKKMNGISMIRRRALRNAKRKKELNFKHQKR